MTFRKYVIDVITALYDRAESAINWESPDFDHTHTLELQNITIEDDHTVVLTYSATSTRAYKIRVENLARTLEKYVTAHMKMLDTGRARLL